MRTIILITALLGAITIVLGAFGAHSLSKVLTATELDSFETGVRYQMYHVLAIFLIGSIQYISEKSRKIISATFLIGILFFSGSIYAITFGFPAKFIWFVTPLGGLFFILGWLLIPFYLFKHKNS